MTLGWGARQLLAFVSLAVLLVLVAGFLELTSAVRLGTRQAMIEAELVAGSVRRELAWFISSSPGVDVEDAAHSAGVRSALEDAIVLAPSIISVAVLSPSGRYIAHSDSSLVGTEASRHSYIPILSGTRDAVRTLWDLRGDPPDYQSETALLRAGQPFATVQVVVSGTFLWDSVEQAISRGLVTAVITLSCALIASVVLSRILTGRVRRLEAGVRALSEGHLDVRVPEEGHDEFTRLAQALNQLGDRFRASALEGGGAAGGAGRVDLAPVLERLGHMASGVAHELRNHLQRAELELSLAGSQEGEELDESVARAREAVRNVEGVVRGYLRLAAIGSLERRSTDVRAMLAEVRDELDAQARMAGVRPTVAEGQTHAELPIDAVVMKQALHNAVRNALQALEGREDGHVELDACRRADVVEVRVTDNGPGMDEETRRRAFDPYFTTREGGSGVGLPLIAQTAELHGGRARIESDASGTTLIMEIPCPERA